MAYGKFVYEGQDHMGKKVRRSLFPQIRIGNKTERDWSFSKAERKEGANEKKAERETAAREKEVDMQLKWKEKRLTGRWIFSWRRCS